MSKIGEFLPMIIKNKRGFVRILEATIGVLLVSSVLLAVYINQQPPQFLSSGDYIYNLQKQILLDISSRSDLRGYVLRWENGEDYCDYRINHTAAYNDCFGESTPECLILYDLDGTGLIGTGDVNLLFGRQSDCPLDDYLRVKIPDSYGYALTICNLNETGACKLNAAEIIATRDRDVFAEEITVAANFNQYSPKKVRLFIWESR